MMNPGELKKRFTIQKKTYVEQPNGSNQETWQDYVTVWSSIKPLRTRNLLLAQQVGSSITEEVKIRYRTDINSTMRGIYQGKIYNFIGDPINVEGRNRELLINCEVISHG